MPLAIYDDYQQETLQEVLGRDAPSSNMYLSYEVGTEDLSDYVIQAEWGRPDVDRPGMEFLADFKIELPYEEYKSAEVRVNLHIEGLSTPIRRFTGHAVNVSPGRGRTTIQAATAGFWLDRIRLDENKSFAGVAPSDVVAYAINKNRRYNRRHANIDQIDGPRLYRDDQYAFTRIDALSDVLGVILEEADLFYRDGPLNAPVCTRNVSPAEAKRFSAHYEVGIDIDPAVWAPELTEDEYSDVVMYRTLDTGDVRFIFEPIKIPNSLAPEGAGYLLEVSDQSSESDFEIWKLGQEVAKRLTMGESRQMVDIGYINPLLVDGDFVTVTETLTSVRSGRNLTRRWLCKILTQKEHHDHTHELELLMVRAGADIPEEKTAERYPTGRYGRLGLETAEPTYGTPDYDLQPSDSLNPSDILVPSP